MSFGAINLVVLLLLCVAVFMTARILVRLEKKVNKIEQAGLVVASNLLAAKPDLRTAAAQRLHLSETLDRMEHATEVVAGNLAESVSRADATEGPDGAAADAALRTGDSAAAIHERQDSQRDN